MKKIRILLATIAMIMISSVALGQSIKIKDPPVNFSQDEYVVPVTVEWHRADGIVLTQTANTTEDEISAGIIVKAPPYWGVYSPILTIKIYVYFKAETHYAVYPGSAISANRLLESQYWIVVPD